jgi:hypothetical protein
MMMVQKLFADAMMALEDLHSVAVEGQRRDNAPDMQLALATHLRAGIVSLDAIVFDIALHLGAAPTPGGGSAMNFYNGFCPRERRAWNGRALPIPRQCSICGCGPDERPLAYHGEDYRSMDSVYAICRRCHYAIHIRFRRPDHWRKVLRQHQYPGAWFTLLSIDPASLWRPFDETYPQGLPGPGASSPREPRLPLPGRLA